MSPVLERWIAAFMAAEEEERRAFAAGALPKESPTPASPRDGTATPPPISALPDTVVQKYPDLQEEEIRAVDLLLRVMRSRKSGLPRAIKENLQQFADADELYEQRQGGAATPAKTGPDQPREVGIISEAATLVEQLGKQHRDLREAAERVEADLRQIGEVLESRQKRYHGRPRKRG